METAANFIYLNLHHVSMLILKSRVQKLSFRCRVNTQVTSAESVRCSASCASFPAHICMLENVSVAEIRSPAPKQMDPRPLYANSEPWKRPLVSEKPEEEPSTAVAGHDVDSHLSPEGQFMFLLLVFSQ